MNPSQAANLPLVLRNVQDSVRRAIAQDLDVALTAVRRRVATLERAYSIAWPLPYDSYLIRQLYRDLESIRVIGMTVDKHLSQDLCSEDGHALVLVHDLDEACALAESLPANLAHPRVAVLMRGLTPHRSPREHARLLGTELTNARRLAVRFLPTDLWRLTPTGEIGSARSAVRSGSLDSGTVVTGMADGHGFALLMLAIAVRALPSPHRSRYLEEFRAELRDHLSLGDRTRYVARLSAVMWSLRRSLPSESELREQREQRLSQDDPTVGGGA